MVERRDDDRDLAGPHEDDSDAKAAVIIVSYQTPQLTQRAAATSLEVDCSNVVVVDNASHDNTRSLLTMLGNPRLRVIANDENRGFGSAANRGARESRVDTLIFLNSDATLDRTAALALIIELQQWGGRAIVAPRLIGPGGAIQHSAGLLPGPVDLTVRALNIHAIGRWIGGHALLAAALGRTRLAREYASAATAAGTLKTTMVSGACFAIGREAFWELGGFDERFFMYFEDADLCRRATVAGMPIRYVPDAVLTHIGGGSSEGDYHFSPMHARSMRQYLGKWYGPAGSVLALALLWLRAVGFSVAVRPQARRAWRALWAAVRDEDPRR